jgi:hypothetical protein
LQFQLLDATAKTADDTKGGSDRVTNPVTAKDFFQFFWQLIGRFRRLDGQSQYSEVEISLAI